MPTYEYLCESCGNRYDKREGFDAAPRQKCPACGKRANRVLHAPPIVFKGSGFYKTDSRGSSSVTSDTSTSSESTEPPKTSEPATTKEPASTPAAAKKTPDTSSTAEATAAG